MSPVPCNSCNSLPIFVNEGDASHIQRLLNHSQAGAEAMGCPVRWISIIVEGSDEEGVEIWNSIMRLSGKRAAEAVERAIDEVNERFPDWKPTDLMLGYARAVAKAAVSAPPERMT